MAITQLSLFLENKPGGLYRAIEIISGAGINIRALSLADTKDFGIMRFIVENPQDAKDVLSKDYIVKETPVVAVKMADQAGALQNILLALKQADINVEYMYAFTSTGENAACVVLRVEDPAQAEAALAAAGEHALSDTDLHALL